MDWNYVILAQLHLCNCHSLRGSVDWNPITYSSVIKSSSHSLRGSVDWNSDLLLFFQKAAVTPFAGVWIEIPFAMRLTVDFDSHSLRGSVDWNCCSGWHFKIVRPVTPFAGVWIEISFPSWITPYWLVTPFAGVWIEMFCSLMISPPCTSLPSRECGLKYDILFAFDIQNHVTPFAGVWIEIVIVFIPLPDAPGHSLRGSVDWNCINRHATACVKLSLPSRECGLKWMHWSSGSETAWVTPFAGVWIEIYSCLSLHLSGLSLPSRECGLKFVHSLRNIHPYCHSLRGSVDWNLQSS